MHTPSWLKFVLTSSSLMIGGLIVVISLFQASQATAMASNGQTSSAKKVYWGREFQPDHLFYPMVVMGERIAMSQLNLEEQVYQHIEYADRRLQYAVDLAESDSDDLAASTALKAEQQLVMAATKLGEVPSGDRKRPAEALELAVERHRRRLEHLKLTVDPQYHPMLDSALDQLQHVPAQLSSL